MDCGECKLPLPTDGDAAVCGKCDMGYHFDCTTVSKSSWMSMGPTRQTAWRCLPCKDVKAKRLLMSSQQLSASQSGGGASSGGGGDDIGRKMEAFGKQLEAFNKNFTEKLNKGFVDSEQKIKAKLNEFEESLNFYGNTIDEANKTVKSLEQKLVLMEKRLEKSENENKELKSRLRTLEVHMHETSQKEYNNKIEISGLVNKNVDSARTVQKILELCNTNQMHAKAELVTRMGENRQEKISMLVQFDSRDDRNVVLGKIKKEKIYTKLNDVTQNGTSSIFINEALCPYYKKLLFEATRIKKDKKYAFLWVKDGRILLKKTADSSTIRLTCLDDLGKI